MNYTLYQNHQKNSSAYMKYFARPQYNETLDTEKLAAKIQRNCSMKHSDVLAVLKELQEVMNEALIAGNKVKLDGIGTFGLGFTSEGVNIPGDFKPSKNIKRVYINFQQAWTRTAGQPLEKFLTHGATFTRVK